MINAFFIECSFSPGHRSSADDAPPVNFNCVRHDEEAVRGRSAESKVAVLINRVFGISERVCERIVENRFSLRERNTVLGSILGFFIRIPLEAHK